MTVANTKKEWQQEVETTLPRGEPVLPIENAWTLKAMALEHVRRLAGKIWTDHNIHDPGIALLDLLCFALSDLGYRTSFPVADLLAEETGVDPSALAPQFFTARDILTTRPVTELDFRKMLIDTPGVKNAWVKPSPHQETPLFLDREEETLVRTPPPLGGANKGVDHEVELRGLNAIYLELSREVEVRDDLNDNVLDAVLDLSPASTGDPRGLDLEVDVAFGSLFDPTEVTPTNPRLYRLDNMTADARLPYVGYDANWSPDRPDWWLRHADDVEVVGVRPSFRWLDRDLMVPIVLKCSVGGAEHLAGVCLHIMHRGRVNLNAAKMQSAIMSRLKAQNFSWLKPLVARHTAKVRRRLEITEDVIGRLQANRALCEDYAFIFGMKIEQVGLCIDIELDPAADCEKVHSEIRLQVEQFLAPDIPFRSLEYLLDQGVDAALIFEGPALDHGFIHPARVAKSIKHTEVNSSDIVNILMDIEGIVAVRDIMMSSYVDNDIKEMNMRWSMPLTADQRHVPRLSLQKSKLNFYKGVIPCGVDEEEAAAHYEEAIGKMERSKLARDTYDIEPPKGRYRALGTYTSIQDQLPLNFGIGHEGLAASESDERKAQAAQLKAFLMFFDQILANYLAQLAGAKDQLSINGTATSSYFVEPVYGAPWIGKMIRDFVEGVDDSTDLESRSEADSAWQAYVAAEPTGYRTNLQAIAEDEATYHRRQNDILDHLLARFAEQFTDYGMLLYDLSGRRRGSAELIEDKRNFLQKYPRLSAARGNGPNHYDKTAFWSADNVSGLAYRVALLVGIKPRPTPVLAPAPGSLVTFSAPSPGKWGFRLTVPASGALPDLIITSAASAHAPNRREAEALYFDFLRIVTEDIFAHFEEQADGTYRLEVRHPDGAYLAESEALFADEDSAHAAFEQLLDFIDDYYFLEGLHVVEHILLRPLSHTAELMPVMLGDDAALPAELADPYSYRASIVLPALARRFRNQDMRALVEETIRMEAPAHVSPKICWIDHAQMIKFETALKSWQQARLGLNPNKDALAAQQNALLTILGELKSIYPTATLHDCEEPDESVNPVVLDHTAIGSFTEYDPDTPDPHSDDN